MKSTKYLVIVNTNKQAPRVIPTIKKLKKDSNNEIVIVVPVDSFCQELEKDGVKCKTFMEYAAEKSYAKVRDETKALTEKWHRIKSDEAFQDLVSYDGISLGNIVEFDLFLFILDVIKNVEKIICVVNVERPDRIIIVDDSDPAGRAAIPIAKEYNIPISVIRPSLLDFNYYLVKYIKPYVVKYVKPSVIKYLNYWTGLDRSQWIKTKYRPERKDEVKNNILALTYGRPDINKIIIPVIHELERDSENRVIVLGSTGSAKKQLESEGITYRTFGDYCTKKIEERVDSERGLLKTKWQKLKDDKDFRESLTYSNIPLWELVEETFSFIYSTTFVQIVKYIETVRHLIKTEDINAMLVPSDHQVTEKTAVTVGNFMEIPTLMVQHGVWVEPLGIPITASKMAVMGEIPKDYFVNLGESPDKLIVTGSSMFDGLLEKKFDKEKTLRMLNLKDDKKIIVFTMQSFPREENEILLRSVLKAMKNLSDVQMVIKPHPIEDEEFYKSLVNDIGATDTVVTKNVNLLELLNACDTLMTVTSTTALEAMILDKPVIIVNLTGRDEAAPYVKNGAALGVYQSREIIPAIEKVLYDKNTREGLENARKKFIRDYAYKIDGKASKRIVELIEKMIEAIQ